MVTGKIDIKNKNFSIIVDRIFCISIDAIPK